MQPLEAKHKVAIGLGLVVLGLVIWVSAKAPAQAPAPAAVAPPASAGTSPHLDINMPNKVVTMLGVPEVILSPPSLSPDDSGAKEDKPPRAARDTELKSASVPKTNSNLPSTPVTSPRKPAARRSQDTFLVKPE